MRERREEGGQGEEIKEEKKTKRQQTSHEVEFGSWGAVGVAYQLSPTHKHLTSQKIRLVHLAVGVPPTGASRWVAGSLVPHPPHPPHHANHAGAETRTRAMR